MSSPKKRIAKNAGRLASMKRPGGVGAIKGFTFTISVIIISLTLISMVSFSKEWQKQQAGAYNEVLPSQSSRLQERIAIDISSILGVSSAFRASPVLVQAEYIAAFPFKREGAGVADLSGYSKYLSSSLSNQGFEVILAANGLVGSRAAVMAVSDSGQIIHDNGNENDTSIFISPNDLVPTGVSFNVSCPSKSASSVGDFAVLNGPTGSGMAYELYYFDSSGSRSSAESAGLENHVSLSVAYADGTVLSLAARPANSVLNGGFEELASGSNPDDEKADAWVSWSKHLGSDSLFQAVSDCYSGSYAVGAIAGENSNDDYVYQQIASLSTGDGYTFSFFAEGSQGDARYALYSPLEGTYLEEDGSWGVEPFIFTASGSGYNQVSTQFIAPGSTVELRLYAPAEKGQKIYYDAVSLAFSSSNGMVVTHSLTKSPGALRILPLDKDSSVANNDVQDYSKYASHMTLGGGESANSPTWVANAKLGGGYWFDGENDFAIGPPLSLDSNSISVANGPDRISSGGFEGESLSWSSNAPGGSTFNLNANSHSGIYSLKVTASEHPDEDSICQQISPLLENAIYNITFWASGNNPRYSLSEPDLKLVLQPDGTWKVGEKPTILAADGAEGSYKQLSFSFVTPANSQNFQFCFYPPSDPSTITYFDDVSLNRAVGLNGGFEYLYKASGPYGAGIDFWPDGPG